MTSPDAAKPTRVRYVVLVLAILIAVVLYVDRYCLSTADRAVKIDLVLTEQEVSLILGAFFFTYALSQIPFGILADRYGPRRMLALYLVAWSAATALLGLAGGFASLLVLRFTCGLFEAGAFPACAGIIKRWIPYPRRGLASGLVSLGGRLGGTITPLLTALLMVRLAGWHEPSAAQQTYQAATVIATAAPSLDRAHLPTTAVAAALSTTSTGSGWRSAVVLYGFAGFVLAAAFCWLFRDSPREHPWCNAAEVEFIARGDPTPSHQHRFAAVGPLFLGVVKNLSLWYCSVVQFGINFGWVFLITYLNRYLQEVHGVPIETRGAMNSLVMGLSLPALVLGGWLTDRMTQVFGPRWGRCLPMALTRLVSALAFLAVPWLDEVWAIVLCFGAVAFFSDLGVPAIWGYVMDVGGRNVGFVLGWGNMWGNLGAAVSPVILNELVTHFSQGSADARQAWDAVFFVYGAVFVVIGLMSLGVDATKRVAAEPPPLATEPA
ncbi:MAG: MFS transporter [Gemmataceae bacterium]|nr:MFS transporter [Gemmataceae bacterium]